MERGFKGIHEGGGEAEENREDGGKVVGLEIKKAGEKELGGFTCSLAHE